MKIKHLPCKIQDIISNVKGTKTEYYLNVMGKKDVHLSLARIQLIYEKFTVKSLVCIMLL